MEEREMRDVIRNHQVLNTIELGSLLVFASVTPPLSSRQGDLADAPARAGIGDGAGLAGNPASQPMTSAPQ